MEKTFNISEAAEIIGVSVKTLQRWDRDGKFLANRTPSNRRYYTEKQLKEIQSTKNIIEGMELKEYIETMKCGDVITIEVDECVEYITKTKWFDAIIFILGGMGVSGDAVVVGSFYEEDDIDVDIVVERIKELVKEDFKVEGYQGKINISYCADEVFENSEDGNFYYRK